MKTIGILAKVQVLLGVVLAGYCLFFSVGKIVEQESAIGKNLVECSKTIDNHRNFLDVSAGNFFKINSSVSKVANGCQELANTIRHVPYIKVVSPYLLNIYDALKEQCVAGEKSKKQFPQTIKMLKTTSTNLKNIGTMLQEESPIKRISLHIRIIGLGLAAIMIFNGIAFAVIAKEKEQPFEEPADYEC